MRNQVTPAPPLSPSLKAANGMGVHMTCLNGLDHAHIRASSWPSGRTLCNENHQMPSSPRSLMSAFEVTPDADEPMISLLEGL